MVSRRKFSSCITMSTRHRKPP